LRHSVIAVKNKKDNLPPRRQDAKGKISIAPWRLCGESFFQVLNLCALASFAAKVFCSGTKSLRLGG
jgi:hypothetical protein